MHSPELGYYIRKMMNVERKLPDRAALLSNCEWLTYQKKAAKLCDTIVPSEDQKRLVFRHM